MNALNAIKRPFNISGAMIAIVTDDEVYSQSDRVTGEVIIAGGEYEQSGTEIKLELEEFWTETRSTGTTPTSVTVTKARDSAILARGFSIHPGSDQRYPFEVQLPRNSRLSAKKEGWSLAANLDIPMAIDPKGRVNLKVEPAKEFLAIVQVCELTLRFEEDLNKRRWHNDLDETCFRLLPPSVLKPELDYLRLELLQEGDGAVSGTLVFDLQEKSIGDYFKAILNLDKVKKPFRLSHDQIFMPTGEPNSAIIAGAIGQCLQEVIRER